MKHANKISSYIKGFLAPLKKANWRTILLSILTATIFWFFNALNKNYTASINYPVDYLYNRDSLVAVNSLPQKLPLNVSGGGWQLLKKTIALNRHPVAIKLERPTQTAFITGNSLLPLFSQQLNGLKVNYVAIDTVYLQIDKIMERTLAVRVDSSAIKLKENYAIVSDVTVQPDSIAFSGTTSMIKTLTDPYIIKLTDKNINSNYNEELSMDLFSSSKLKKEPEVIRVMFDVDEYIDQATPLKIEQVNFPNDSSIHLAANQVEARYLIQKRKRKDIGQLEFMVIADHNNINPVDSTIALEIIKSPGYIRNLTLAKQKVKVVYGKKAH